MANDFFKGNVKVYSENLNDSLLVGNAFDWTVDVSLPSDTGGVFPNSSTIVKAKMADVSITPNSNLSIGSSIENSSGSSQVYRLTVYPNFNRFGGFKSISLTADSGVTFYIANKGGTSPIANNLDYDDLSNVPELKVLKEYDIVVTIPNNGEVTGLGFVFQSSSANVSSSINQSNVTGLNNTITAIQGKDTEQDGRLSLLEGTVNDLFDLIYPVGSIYMSVNSTSPQTLFGGTWEQIKDTFLLASGSTYANESTGGSADAVVVSHNHTQSSHTHEPSNTAFSFLASQGNIALNETKRAFPSASSSGHYFVYSDELKGINEYDTTSSSTPYINSTGVSGTGKNMPPYLAVNVWKRTA